MNVIETVRRILSECDIMDEFNGIHVDYTEAVTGFAGLFPNGATKTGEDLIGNPKYRITFALYTGLSSANDYDRLANSDLLLRLTYFLNQQKNIAITETVNGNEYPGEITRIFCSNGLLFDYPTGDPNDGVRYQLQIGAEYAIYTED